MFRFHHRPKKKKKNGRCVHLLTVQSCKEGAVFPFQSVLLMISSILLNIETQDFSLDDARDPKGLHSGHQFSLFQLMSTCAKNPRASTTVAMERKSCGVFKDITAVGNKTQPHRLLHISSVVASAPPLAVHRTEFKAWRLDVSCHNASWKSWLTSPLTALCRLYVVCMCASTRGDSCPS